MEKPGKTTAHKSLTELFPNNDYLEGCEGTTTMAEIKVKNAASSGMLNSQDRCSAKGMPEDSDSDREDSETQSTLLNQASEVESAEEKNRAENDGVPYDSGWAWMVLCGCFVNYVILSGYLSCLGLFYVEILRRYDAHATEAGLFVMSVVVGQLGIRTTVLIGALMYSISGILSSLVDNMVAIVVLIGGLVGLGQAMVMPSGDVLLGHYFRKRRSLALGLAKCGASLGNMLAPPLISFFLETYGLFGTLLLTGGLCLHFFPAAMLFRPTTFYSKRKVEGRRELSEGAEEIEVLIGTDPRGDVSVEKDKSFQMKKVRPQLSREKEGNSALAERSTIMQGATGEGGHEINESNKGLIPDINNANALLKFSLHTGNVSACQRQENSASDELQQENDDSNPGQPRKKIHTKRRGSVSDTLLEATRQSSSKRKDSSKGSLDDSCNTSHVEANTQTGTSDQNLRQSYVHKQVAKCCKAAFFMLDFSLFALPLFRLLLAYFVLFPFINIMVNYLPALAVESGFTESDGALLLTIIGVLDLVCRLSCALLINFRLLKVSTILAIAFLVLGVTSQFIRFMTSWELLVVLSVLLGLLGGVPNTTISMLVLDCVGLDRMSKTLGFVIFTLGACTSAYYPLLGYIRDRTGSYFAVYHVLGGGSLLAAAILSCERWVRPLQEKRINVSPGTSHTL
ncbi:monocarboxylate transporter 12-like isoform X2 [Littorina saxatilis]|uniref:monocarboxylate transporter 12-like isoform X2 n=1 Tax=Littorina saxatilis TaxID=31220 RepID=UPI0038B41D38